MSSRAARSNNGCLTNSRICTWYVMMDPKITPSGQTIVKPTALGTVANTDAKLLIYRLFQEGRVLAQDAVLRSVQFNFCRSFSRASSRRTLKVEMRARTNDEIMPAWCRQTGD